MARRTMSAVLILAGLLAAGAARAEPTPVTVRALAKDAKFIGDSMGGVEITLKDAASGSVLAKGLTRGGTGDTARLVEQPKVRRTPVSTPDAAGFSAVLDLDRPTLVRAEARGPLGKPDAVVTVTSMMWLLPGRGVEGDGWILEMPGLVVEPQWSALGHGQASLSAKVTLMCGCPITPGGLWDASRYEVDATLIRDGRATGRVRLTYAGSPSTFSIAYPDVAPGRYRLIVTAHDAGSGNSGVAEREVVVE
ncbi:MAG: hypothetical protein ACK4YQ_10865 [Phenylobacterium sp.]|uniref:hypothetical protein n=1 Tax=Phenylobacterium sp. TaxID=1871053 RepID=UPI00391CCEDB